MTIDIIGHDNRSNLRQKGAGGEPLRHELRARFRMIYHQEGINGLEVEGMVEFKLKHYYKITWGSLEATLGFLRFEPVQSIEHQATLPPMSTRPNRSSVEMMTATRTKVRFAEVNPEPCVTQEEPGEAVAAPEVLNPPRMPRPQKVKKTMGRVQVSPRNPRFSKLSVAEKGKAITVEIEEEEEEGVTTDLL